MSSYTIKAGDTYTSIASSFNTNAAAIQSANPGVNPSNLQVGQVINLPGQPTINYTIASGDTLSSIASKFSTTVAALQTANPGINPTNLQIGQVIKTTLGTPVPAPPNTTPPAPSAPPITPTPPIPLGTIYIIVSGDTYTSIATKNQTSVAAIQAVNPGVDPTKLQVGQTINLPSGVAPAVPTPNPKIGPSVGAGYVLYSGPAANFPPQSSWADYSTLWASNSKLMSYNDTPSQVALIGEAVVSIAAESGVDARAILCIIMQESGGNVHVRNTSSPDGVNNTGIMQAHNGAGFDPNNEAGSIRQMVRDGAMGTAHGDGLMQTLRRHGNYYAAFRAYNSGSVDASNLGFAFRATEDYVTKVANRLMGHVWAGM